MPHQHHHRHLHGRRNIIDDFGDWVDKLNPFGPDNGSDGGSGPDQNGDGGGTTIVIYKTMAPTFSGPIAGYSTLREDPSPPPSKAPKQNPPPTSVPKPAPKPSSTSSSLDQTSSSFSMPTAIHEPTRPLSTSLESIAKATGQASVTNTDLGGDLGALQPSSATASPSTGGGSGDAGPSAGAKAGIAFGVLGGVFAVGLLVFLMFNRRRKQAAERQQLDGDDEKRHGAVAGASASEPMSNRSDPKAPRISLRPVTQFLPNWNGLDRRASKGAAMSLAPAAAAAAATRAPGGSAWERPTTSQSTNPSNPFGSQAERVRTPIPEEPSLGRPTSPSGSAPAGDPLTANGPAVAAGAAALSRKTSMRKAGPQNVDLTLPQRPGEAPPSPAGTEFSESSISPGHAPPPSSGAAAIAAAGGPQNSSVHRVQLDFQPTLEDEMELRAGELVRLLHEYDDGWALVIRLDRSKQGVVPRTCLSTRPVKPRPPPGAPRPGPPVNPQGMPRNGRPGLPESPARPRMAGPPRPASPAGYGGRAQSPMGRPMSPAGRPMSPGPRAQSPGPRHQGPPAGRPQSPSGMTRQMSPPGPSPMNQAQSVAQEPPSGPPTGPVGRKPVPGQAL